MNNIAQTITNDSVSSFLSAQAENALILNEGILVGGGGGYTQRYIDCIVTSMANTYVTHYYWDWNSNNRWDRTTTPLLTTNRDAEYQSLMQKAVDIGLFELTVAPAASTMIQHITVNHPIKGMVQFSWDYDTTLGLPQLLIDFNNEVRTFIAHSFQKDFAN